MNGIVLNSPSPDGFYILVQLVPCIAYYSYKMILRSLVKQIERDLMRQKKKTVSWTLTLIIGAELAGASTGIAGLTLQEKNYNNLKIEIDEEI